MNYSGYQPNHPFGAITVQPMNKRELIQAVAAHTDVDNKTAAKLVEGTIDVILATVAKGDVVNIHNNGKYVDLDGSLAASREKRVKAVAGGSRPVRGCSSMPVLPMRLAGGSCTHRR